MLQSVLPGVVEAVLAPLSAWILTCAVLSTVLLGLAWVVDGRVPGLRTPASRIGLWTLAVVAPVIVASVQVAGGIGPRLTLEAPEAEKVVADFSAPADVAARASAGASSGEEAAVTSGPGRATLRDPYVADRSDPGAWWASLGHDWPFLVALAWLTVTALLLLRRVVAWRRLARALSNRVRVREGPLRDALEAVMASAGVDETVVVSKSDAVASPVALPRGEICVPPRAETRLDDRERRALLAHEVAHVLRKDTRRLVLLAVLHDLLFFQPLLHLARRRVEAAAEEQSDDWARSLGLGRPLARSLVAVARWVRAGPAGTGLARMTGPAGIEDRVRRLLGAPRERGRVGSSGPGRLLPGVAAAVLIALALPAAEIGTPAHPVVHGPPVAAATDDARGPGATPRWIRSSTVAPPEALDSRLAALAKGRGEALYLRLTGTTEALSVTVRSGSDGVRLIGPDGRSLSWSLGPGTAGQGGVAFLGLVTPGVARLELRVPDRVERLAIEVDGRTLADPGALSGGDLPRIVSSP